VVNELYPFQGHFFERDGLRLHYLDEGSGEAVVMVHGNPTWSFYFRNLVLALRGSYRTIVPDHIGCGLSDKPGDAQYPYTLARRAEDLEALLDHLGLDHGVTLVLHDWGGMIGLVCAMRRPERIRRLVLLNTAGFLLPKTKRLPWSLWVCRNTPLGPLLVRGLNAFCRGAARFCCQRPLSPEVRSAYLRPYDSWSHRIAVLRFVQDIPLRPGDPSYDLVKRVQDNLDKFRGLPVLICWGERDFVFDEHFRAEWERRLPKAEMHRFPNAGHYVLEDAGEEIIPLVQLYLAAHP
jgi:cis-3-alkyl-4-acyloxetan-2-one decarboxylase